MSFLPYGSSDISVIFANDLKSTLTTGNMPFSDVAVVGTGSGNVTHDANGMKALGTTSGERGYLLTLPDAAMQALDSGFQLSIDIEAPWLTAQFNNGSTGDVLAAVETLISMVDTGISSVNQFFKKLTTGEFNSVMNSVDCDGEFLNMDFVSVQDDLPKIHSNGKGSYITLNLAVYGLDNSNFLVGINGFPLVFGVTSAAGASGFFDNFYIGSDREIPTTFVDGRYFKNLQIASSLPVWTPNTDIGTVSILSDSIQSQPFNGGTNGLGDIRGFDQFSRTSMQRGIFESTGKHIPEIIISTNGGDTIGTYSGSGANTTLVEQVASILSNDPDYVFLNGGTNDAFRASSDYTLTEFEDGLLDTVAQLFLTSTLTVRTTVKGVVVFVPPPNYNAITAPTFEPAFDDIRAAQLAFPAVWDAAYPFLAGLVVVEDNFVAMGSDHNEAQASVFPCHTEDNTHPTPCWNNILGDTLVSGLNRLLENTVTEETRGQSILNGDVVSALSNLSPNAAVGQAGADFWQIENPNLRLKSLSWTCTSGAGGDPFSGFVSLYEAPGQNSEMTDQVIVASGEVVSGLAAGAPAADHKIEFPTFIVLDPAKWYGIVGQGGPANINGWNAARTSLTGRTGDETASRDITLGDYPSLESTWGGTNGFDEQYMFSAVLSDAQSATGSPTLTTHSSTMGLLVNAGNSGGVSIFTYKNSNIATAQVISTDFWIAPKFELKPLDVIWCQLSDGFVKLSMITATTAEAV